MILAIDPGNIESAYVKIDEITLKPIEFNKLENTWLISKLLDDEFLKGVKYLAIEMVASYGMAVGKEVFDTCVWIGKFDQVVFGKNIYRNFIYRKDEKINLCHSMKANDSNITQALIDRFAPGVRNKGKGTKQEPGWFYGFKKDIWQAYAVGVTYHDLYIEGDANE